jgi:CBS-domain-containing membrane protein
MSGPTVIGHNGGVIGIVTEADLMLKEEGRPEAARVMHRQGVKRLRVVGEDGRLVGIVSRREPARVFRRPDQEIRDEIADRLMWRDRRRGLPLVSARSQRCVDGSMNPWGVFDRRLAPAHPLGPSGPGRSARVPHDGRRAI